MGHRQGREWVCTQGCSLGLQEGGVREGGNFPIKLVKSVQSPVSLLVEGSRGASAPTPGPPRDCSEQPPLGRGVPQHLCPEPCARNKAVYCL